MPHQPNSAQFHGHSISSTLFQNDHISHPVKRFKSSLKNKQIKKQIKINQSWTLFLFVCFVFTGLEGQPRVYVYKMIKKKYSRLHGLNVSMEDLYCLGLSDIPVPQFPLKNYPFRHYPLCPMQSLAAAPGLSMWPTSSQSEHYTYPLPVLQGRKGQESQAEPTRLDSKEWKDWGNGLKG